MAAPFRFRCELTTDRLEVAGAEVEALVLWAEEASFKFRQARPRVQPHRLRWFGLTLALLGLVVGDLGIVLAPDGDWTSWPQVFYYSTIPVFAGAGSFFWFQVRALEALRRWSRRRLRRMVHRLLEPARRRAPAWSEYLITEGRFEARVEAAGLVNATQLRRVRVAVAGRHAVCLYRRPPTLGLARVFFVPDAETRRGACEALIAEGLELVEPWADSIGGLEDPPTSPRRPPSRPGHASRPGRA
jgi:hypothetical protein